MKWQIENCSIHCVLYLVYEMTGTNSSEVQKAQSAHLLSSKQIHLDHFEGFFSSSFMHLKTEKERSVCFLRNLSWSLLFLWGTRFETCPFSCLSGNRAFDILEKSWCRYREKKIRKNHCSCCKQLLPLTKNELKQAKRSNYGQIKAKPNKQKQKSHTDVTNCQKGTVSCTKQMGLINSQMGS